MTDPKPAGSAPVSPRWARVRRGALVSVAILLACEAGAWAVLGGRSLSPAVFERDPDGRGHRLSPNAASRVRLLGRDALVSVDAAGHRRTIGAPRADAGVISVHLVGDSQVFGWGLGDDETIASRLQAELGAGFRVVNHGVPGTGPFAYQAAIARIPAQEWTVVVHTEENDLWDAYGMAQNTSVRCGYLAPALAGGLPCPVLGSRLFQVAGRLYEGLYYKYRPAPLGYHPYARLATSVLLQRATALYADARGQRGPRIVFTYVPWVARYAADRLPTYFPPPVSPERPLGFPDDCGAEAAFQGGGRELYLDGDSHLSGEGAGRLAGAMARELRRRLSSPQGNSPEEAAS